MSLQVVFESLKSGGDEVVLAEMKVTPSDPPCDVDPPEAGTGRVVPTDLPSASPCPPTPQTGRVSSFKTVLLSGKSPDEVCESPKSDHR